MREIERECTSSHAARIVGAPCSELGPRHMSVMSSDLSDLFFVALDAPESTNIVSVDETVVFVLCTRASETGHECAQNELPRDVHN